ncbi:hypothetical protein [Leptospira sp. GIMC2001]|uniref:hypothetical protein n=1 Tax=Leptospira sp. GIMC2001 TaxID=1513297 RepID=UPI00234916AD|nr:hypothetical protein [Leptospira sp. GIMC2001]WCL51492.1 hypothetical protein O4O04_19955 [Leptospira sp. GIMC2001]
MSYNSVEEEILQVVNSIIHDTKVWNGEEFKAVLRGILSKRKTCTANERLFLDELMDRWAWEQEDGYLYSVELSDKSFIVQSDFTASLKELVE